MDGAGDMRGELRRLARDDPERLKRVPADERPAFLTDWGAWAHDPQLEPEGDWTTWVILGGRGGGKTRAGAEWVERRSRRTARIALIGQSLHDVREVMIEGPSGIRAASRLNEAPRWEATRRRLLWPNGAVAETFSAEDPEALRGPQFGAAWADEWCAWRKPADTLALLRMGLRIGRAPRLVITTTPRPTRALKALLAEPGVRRTDLPTRTNRAHLAPAFVEGLEAVYGGTRLAAQEIEGLVVDDAGALFTAEMMAGARASGSSSPSRGGQAAQRPGGRGRASDFGMVDGLPSPSHPVACGDDPPPQGEGEALELAAFDRVVVAVDPPATSGGAACGIVVAGRRGRTAWVLADRTAAGLSPQGWAAEVARAARDYGADGVVAEGNQGGEMVEAVLKAAGVPCPVRRVHASVGKRARAEPVAALYEQGRVRHARAFPALEEQLMALGAQDGGPSPDRADALVWAVTELLLNGWGDGPRIRVL